LKPIREWPPSPHKQAAEGDWGSNRIEQGTGEGSTTYDIEEPQKTVAAVQTSEVQEFK